MRCDTKQYKGATGLQLPGMNSKGMESGEKLFLLLGLYVAALYTANLLGGKLLPIGFGDRGLSVGIFAFPFLFLITDIVGEVYGKQKAQLFVKVGLVSLLLLLAWQFLFLALPAATPSEWYNIFNPAYETVFGLSLTFTIASIIAFICGQYIDVGVYHSVKRLTKDRHIWLRNNVSTIVGQFIDSSVWVLIAFSPRLMDGSFTVLSLFSLIIIPYWLAKVVFALLDTPLAYLGVWWLKGSQEKKTGK